MEALILFLYFGLIPFSVEDAINQRHGFSPQSETNVYHDDNEQMLDFPYPPENYGQYNSPITQKDISQMDFPILDKDNNILTREIRIKQGRLKGLVREMKNRKLNNVEMYLGIPYAAPPTRSLRFMPPRNPPNWSNVRIFDSFGSVCPQMPPDITHEPLRTMTAGRFNHLKGLLPFLRNQSEDCLYLNIYAPAQGDRSHNKYPVMVYIHGESFEWNSGNPYDGSILAAYGKVVVVTINFRLGILGFLRPGISDHTVSNFGLLDQIAALQWVKENIGEFGGDASSVTLMGHGTGAACINFLMVSPVSDGLFHKAILMSGTALSDWALTINPLQFTVQVAEALNCPVVEENDELSNCLRKKRLSEIMAIKINVPEFRTPFGPLVDGSVIPNSPEVVMGVYKNLFTRYDLLYGITEWESYHSLNAVSLAYGMLERERDHLLRQYMHSRFEVLPDFALATTLSEYTDWRREMERPAAEEHRDLVLDVLSDARVAAPIIQMGVYHSSSNPKSYLYIFKHKSFYGEFAGSERSISGEEIAYVFGAPLANEEGSLSHHTFNLQEQLLCEAIITYFTNFAKTGNPNAPRRSEYLSQSPREWQQYDIDWPEFDSKNQSYLVLDTKPQINHHYRHQMIKYWNEILPERLSNPSLRNTRVKPKQQPPETIYPPDDNFGIWVNPPYHQHKHSTDPPPPFFKQPKTRPTSWTYGTIKNSPVDQPQPNRNPKSKDRERIGPGQMDHPVQELNENKSPEAQVASSMALTFFIIIGVCFLIINIFAFTLLYYKRKRLKLEENRLNQLCDELDDGGFGEREEIRRKGCGGGIYDMVTGSKKGGLKSDELYEAIKTRSKERSRKCSTSTVDPHTKVREWIQHEIIEKYSPAILRRGNRQIYQEEIQSNSDGFEEIFEPRSPSSIKPILKQQQSTETDLSYVGTLPRRGYRKNVQKVSVGVDATPSARSASVLKQTPIEITKSLDRGLLTSDSSPDSGKERDDSSLRRSRTSISLQTLPLQNDEQQPTTPLEPTVIKIQHFHSKSDPIEMNFQTFAAAKDPGDVNVTSRDSEIILKPENLPENTLKNIQKRNFPKVLPDFPESSKNAKRLSLPPSSHLIYLPSQGSNTLNRNKVPPPPPPRISTLDRRLKEKPQQADEEPKTVTSSAIINFKTPTEKKETIDSEKPKMETKKSSQIPIQKQSPKTVIVASSLNQNQCTVKRQEPNIIIQSTTGPKKTDVKTKSVQKSTPHVNLQSEESLSYVRDSKGPSDKPTTTTGFEKVVSSKPKKKQESKVESPAKSADAEGSSSSSSLAKDSNSSTGTVRKIKKETKDAST